MRTRRDQVRAAIRMQGPDYVPLYFVNRDQNQSDLVMIDVVRHFVGEKRDLSEWGFRWDRTDRTMGQPREPLVRAFRGKLPGLRQRIPGTPRIAGGKALDETFVQNVDPVCGSSLSFRSL